MLQTEKVHKSTLLLLFTLEREVMPIASEVGPSPAWQVLGNTIEINPTMLL